MRKDDLNNDKPRFRSNRMFHDDDGWYIATREGHRGPFPSKKLAVIELRHYLRTLALPERRAAT